MRNVIIIPIHKLKPDKWEYLSLKQCFKILRNHPICIVTHSDINIHHYLDIASQYGVKLIREDYNSVFFANIAGYNRLMLDSSFYKRFSIYEYMLIYQLDAWVFRDELDYWCNQGYDYIGAPWIKKDKTINSFHFDGVGNGGFSLRRIQHFIDVLSYKGPVRDGNNLNLEPSIKNKIYKFLYSRGYQNTISYLKKDETLYEDIFLSIFLNDTKLKAYIPDPITASQFAFEKEPSYLYSINQKLPFGCHAWRKYEYDSFWQQFITSHTIN